MQVKAINLVALDGRCWVTVLETDVQTTLFLPTHFLWKTFVNFKIKQYHLHLMSSMINIEKDSAYKYQHCKICCWKICKITVFEPNITVHWSYEKFNWRQVCERLREPRTKCCDWKYPENQNKINLQKQNFIVVSKGCFQ